MVTKIKKVNCEIDPDKMFDAIMRKWSIIILKDMFLGAKRFNDFREMNPKISGKVLSDQLKNLEKYGFIEKVVVSTTPIKCEYHLTDMGRGLNRFLYELMVFVRTYVISESECEQIKEENLKKCFGV